MSSDGLQQQMHLPPYREKQRRSHSALDIAFPDGLEAFKALRTFRILTKSTKETSQTKREVSGMLHQTLEQNMHCSIWQQAVPHGAVFKEDKSTLPDKDAVKVPSMSEGGKGGLKCDDVSVCKKFPSSNFITTSATNGGAIQANIQSLKVLFSQDAAFDKSQSFLQQTHMPPLYEIQSSHLPSVAIEPSFLEWGERPLYSPGIMPLTIMNTCNSTFLKVFQLYSTAVQFYSTSFQESTIGPGKKLDININYLPRTLGAVDAVIVLETSAGGFLIHAQGFGVASPYKLPPLVTVSLEKGRPFKQNLTLYNPYDKDLEVREIQAWPLDPINRKLHLFCGSNEADDAREQIPSRVRTNCFAMQDTPNNYDCSLYEAEAGLRSCLPSINEMETFIKFQPLESWKIEPHQSSQIAIIEVNLKTDESWTTLFHIRLANTASMTGDGSIIIPMEILVQQSAEDISQLKLTVQVLDFGMLKETLQVLHIQNTRNGPVQVEEVHEDFNKCASSLEDKRVCFSGTNAPSKSCACKEVKGVLMNEVDYGVHTQSVKRKFPFPNNSISTSISVGTVSYHAKMPRQFFTCPQLCLHSDGELNDFCQTYKKLMLSQKCSNMPISSIEDVDKRTGLQDLVELTTFPEQAKSSWDRYFPMLMTQMNISHLSGALLEFPTAQIGRPEMQYLRVTNPNEWPLSLQLVLYAQSEAVDCICSYRDAIDTCMEQLHQSIEFTGDISAGSTTKEKKLHTNVFSITEEAVSYATLEAHGESILGPLFFRPPSSCLWSGLLIIANNVSGMEWLLLQGRGGSAHFTLLDKDVPIQTLTLPSDASYISTKENPKRIFPNLQAIAGNNMRRFHVVSAKNTGNALLEIYSVGILNGSNSANGLDVDGPRHFSLKAGQSTELIIYFYVEQIAAVSDVYLQIYTSIGRFNIPILVSVSNSLLSSDVYMALYTKYETIILQISVFALILVLIIFSRLLIQEMSQGNNSKPVSPKPDVKISMKQKNHLTRTYSSSDIPSSPTSKVTYFDHSSQPRSSPVFQFKIAEDTSEIGLSKRKDSLFNSRSARALIAVVSSLTVIIGSVFSFSKCEPNYVPTPPKISSIQVKSEIESASGVGRSSKERASTTARKGAEKKQITGRSENQQVSLAAQPASKGSHEEQTKEISLSTPKSNHGHSRSLTSFGDKPESPRATTPRENRTQNPFSNAQSHFSDLGPGDRSEKDKGKRKVRQSNLGALKQEERSKSRSGSSSSGSSPASPATPVSPSRSVSPLFYAESDPKLAREKRNMSLINSKAVKGAQPGSPLRSKHNANNFSEQKQLSRTLACRSDLTTNQDNALAEKWWPSLSETEPQAVREEREEESYKPEDQQSSIIFEVLNPSVALKEGNFEGNPWSYGREPPIFLRKQKSTPALTTSATFPRGGRRLSSVEDKIIGNPYLVAAPVVSPSTQAPRSRVSKSNHLHTLGPLNYAQQNEKLCGGSWVGCDFQDNCSCCGRVSVDGSESSSNPDGDLEQVSSNLEYDIWGNHFANISHSQQQNRFTRSLNRSDSMVERLANYPSSLFIRTLNRSDPMVKSLVNHPSNLLTRISNRSDSMVENMVNHPSSLFTEPLNRSDQMANGPSSLFTRSLNQSDPIVESLANDTSSLFTRSLNQSDPIVESLANDTSSLFARSLNRSNQTVESLGNDPSSLFSASSHLMHVNSRILGSGSSLGSSAEFSMFTGNSFADIPFSESSSPKINLPSAEDVTFASVESFQSRPYVIPQKRNYW
ncbi:hypothetical protein O6H91_02G128900 [Diphasiastrum complanatum]|nr:hypothetical protein O6H91_02G128900 [Diphasiastrum complanatum]